jgi:1-acyl-sn-glycerol-3-phosphate acyltransferase
MAYWILKVVLSPLIRCLYRLDVVGRENVPEDGAVILASNHQSFIDSVFIPLVVGRRVTFVAKAEYFENWRTAWIFKALGQIPIKRGAGSSTERALASAREVLLAGGVLGIYPEGTRSPDGRLYKGHSGVARLALSCQAAVVPVALSGTAAVQPIGTRFPRILRPVSVRIGTPLRWPATEEAGNHASLRRVTEEVMVAVAELSGQERVDHYGKSGAVRREAAPTTPGPVRLDPATGRGPEAGGSSIDLSGARDRSGPVGVDRTETASFRR